MQSSRTANWPGSALSALDLKGLIHESAALWVITVLRDVKMFRGVRWVREVGALIPQHTGHVLWLYANISSVKDDGNIQSLFVS